MGSADAVAGGDVRPVARLCGLLSNRSSFPNRFDFACAGRLQQGKALAGGCLRIPVALSFVLDLQAGPFVRIHGLEVGSFEFAIGGGLRRQQRRVRPPDFWFGISIWFGISTGAHGSVDGRRFAFAQGRTDFTLRRIARASGKKDRAKNDADGQKFWRERFRTGKMPLLACFFARSPKT